MGGSAGINVAGAYEIAKSQQGSGKSIVTLLCDGGARYASKLYNPSFLHSKGLPVAEWIDEDRHRAKISHLNLDEAVKLAMVSE